MADANDLVFRFTSTATGISSLEEQDPPVAIFEVLEVKGREALSDLYAFEIELFSDDPFIDGFQLINKRATLEIDYKDDTAMYQGIVASFEEEARGRYRAILVPQLWTAGLTKQCQIFQEKDLATIVTDVLKENGLKENDDFSVTLKGKHPKHDYIVQYEESDLNFIRRLMEHEGAYFWFEHGDKKEKLIIRDIKDAHLAFQQDPEVLFRNPGFVADVEIISSMKAHHRVLPQKVILKDYNYRKPSLEMKATADATKDGSGFMMEYGNHFKTPEEGNELAQVRADEIKCRETVYTGTGACRRFHPGYRFLLKDDLKIWRHESLELVIVSVQHFGKQEFMGRGRGDRRETAGRTTYHNDFEAITADVQFRPERKTPKPRLHGVMHANIDAGGSGQYAEIDDQGRYKVKLPFDLSDASKGKASKFIRKAEPYAGANYGQHFPLHKGIEVLLTHVGGDLDRPLIDSAVANPETASPVSGPNQTQSVMRTAAQNEMVIEDQAGSERIKIHSPFDNSTVWIGSPVDSTDGIRLTTDGHGVVHAKKGIYLNAWPTDYWDTGSASQIINGAIGAAAAIGGAAAAAGGGGLAFLGAVAGVAGAVANVAAPGIVLCSPAGISAMTPSTFTAAGMAGVGLLTPAMANVVGVASAALMSGGGVNIYTIGGGIRVVASFGVIKINARSSNISAIAKKFVFIEAQTNDVGIKGKKNVVVTAVTDDINAKAKKNIIMKAETENINLNAKKTMVLRADTESLVASAKKGIQIIAEDEDFNIGAQTTKLILKAKEEIVLECGDSKIILRKSGDIMIAGKSIVIEGESASARFNKDGFELEGDKGKVTGGELLVEAVRGGTNTIKGGLVKIN